MYFGNIQKTGPEFFFQLEIEILVTPHFTNEKDVGQMLCSLAMALFTTEVTCWHSYFDGIL